MTQRDTYIREQRAKAEAFDSAASIVPGDALYAGVNIRDTLRHYARSCRQNADESANMDAAEWGRVVGAYLSSC